MKRIGINLCSSQNGQSFNQQKNNKNWSPDAGYSRSRMINRIAKSTIDTHTVTCNPILHPFSPTYFSSFSAFLFCFSCLWDTDGVVHKDRAVFFSPFKQSKHFFLLSLASAKEEAQRHGGKDVQPLPA